MNTTNNNILINEPTGTKKQADIIQKITEGKNIVCTHALFFDTATASIIDTIKASSYNYHLFVDEEPNIIKGTYLLNNNMDTNSSVSNMSLDDLNMCIDSGVVEIGEPTGRLIWSDSRNYRGGLFGREGGLADLIQKYDVYQCSKNEAKNTAILLVMAKGSIWETFKSVLVFSYRVKYSLFGAYCKLYGIDFEYYHIEKNSNLIKVGFKDVYPSEINRLCIDDT